MPPFTNAMACLLRRLAAGAGLLLAALALFSESERFALPVHPSLSESSELPFFKALPVPSEFPEFPAPTAIPYLPAYPVSISSPWRRPGGDSLTILFTGDVMLGRDVAKVIRYSGAESLFTPSVDSAFASADAVVANLECPATDVESPLNKRFVFRADPAVLPVLTRHGITHMNLANNHSIDQGREGLADTRRRISAAGMTPVGYGDNDAEACRPVLIGGGPRPVYLLASLRVMSENYVALTDRPCVCEASPARLCDTIRALKSREPDACVIVCLHWGAEHTLHPMAGQRHEARMLIRAGADAIVGHHSHTAQDVETVAGRPVFYSLGNFIFDLDRPLNRRGLLARITVTASGITFGVIETEIEGCRPRVTGRVEKE